MECSQVSYIAKSFATAAKTADLQLIELVLRAILPLNQDILNPAFIVMVGDPAFLQLLLIGQVSPPASQHARPHTSNRSQILDDVMSLLIAQGRNHQARLNMKLTVKWSCSIVANRESIY